MIPPMYNRGCFFAYGLNEVLFHIHNFALEKQELAVTVDKLAQSAN